jgi:Fe-S oxidoreductase
MIEFEGFILSVEFDYAAQKWLITIQLEDKADKIDKLKGLIGVRQRFSIKDLFKARTKTANAYLWELIGKLANELQKTDGKVSKERLYQDYIRHHGRSVDYALDPAPAKAMKALWENYGLGWFTDLIDTEPDGKQLIRFYYGSSCYSSKRFNRLIDAVIQDCKAMGIETIPPDKLKEMMSHWKA